MSIWNKILLGLITVALLGFFYMSARMLKTQKYWSTLAQQYNNKIGELQKSDKDLQEGNPSTGEPGIDQLRSELNILSIGRPRVWYNCDPQASRNLQTGTVTIKVIIDQPNPSGIANKAILYVFEEAPTAQKGRYLGEFKVTAVADKQITLDPAFKLMPADLEKFAQPKRPWTLYDSLPHDNREIFAQVTQQDKKAMLPADSAAEYIDDGQPAAQGAPAQNVVGGKYVRQLRDYSLLFDVYRMKITELVDEIEAAKRDGKMVDDTLADAQRQVKFYQDQTTVVKAVRDNFFRQRDAVIAHLDKLREKIAEVKADMEKFIQENKAMAGQIAKIQLDATRRIDQRTRAMAQSNGEK